LAIDSRTPASLEPRSAISDGQPPDAAAASLRGKRAVVLLYSGYPGDPRPRREAEALARAGMRVEVICLREKRGEPTRQTINGVDVRRVPVTRHRRGVLSYLFQYCSFITISFLLLTARRLRHRIHLVHVHNMPDVLVFSALVPKLLGAKVILDLHDPMPELMMTIYNLGPASRGVRLLKRLERWSIAFADLVLTPNLAFKELFASRAASNGKIHIVMNAPDEEFFPFRPAPPASHTPSKPFVLLYHGSILERNGLGLAVEATSAVRSAVPGVELHIYGHRTAFLDQVMHTVKERGLQDTVRYLGSRRVEDLAAIIDRCDVGLIPNQRSTFTELNMPTRIFEYLARGKPVVAPRTTGILDYFSDHSLVFFELGDAADLAQKIEYIHRHPADVTPLVQRGQQVYLANRWSGERDRLIGLVAGLLARSR
jgi:glycosyltransferase involved in cell wall biosynthesis